MTYTPRVEKTQSIPIEPAVLSLYIPNITDSGDLEFEIPFDGCRLAHAATYVIQALDGNSDVVLTLELNGAGGTEMGVITVDTAAGIGDKDEMVISSEDACNALGRSDTINVQVEGDGAALGAVQLLLYFEYAQ